MFKKFVGLLNHFRKKEGRSEKDRVYSKFEEFLFFLDEDDEYYPFVSAAVEHCSNALKIVGQRAVLDKKIKEYSSILEEMKGYEKLTEKEANYFKELVNKLISITKEKNNLKFQICDFDNSLNKLVSLEEEAREALPQIKESELKEAAAADEIARLNDSKDKLEDEKENFDFALIFIHRASVVTAVVFSGVVFALVMLAVFAQRNIFLPLTILCFCLMFFITFIYVFRRSIVYEIKRNSKQQAMVVNVLNKKLVVYAYYHNFLTYEYKKYGAASSAALENNLRNYESYKSTAKKYDRIKNINYQTEKLLESFMREKKIKDTSSSLERFAKTINIDDKIEYAKDIAQKKEAAEKKLAELDKKHEIIWDELVKLNVNDKSKDRVIEKIIKLYLKEAEAISSKPEDNKEIDEKNILN